MKLSELIKDVETVEVHADPGMEISSLVTDSRRAEPGCAFVAVRGYSVDGHRFIPSAIAAGASLVICEQAPEGDVPYVTVEDSRRAMALCAGNFYGNPARQMRMIGVTGTNGKTTVTNLIKTILETAAGAKVGLIGTNRDMIGSREVVSNRTTPTTPDAMELQALLRRMADEGCGYVVMEVSSIALCLDRVQGIRFYQGIFTNLTEDHLDFHRTMEDYAEAKSCLFSMCDTAIVNIDDPWAGTMLEKAAGRVFTYSAGDPKADLYASDVALRMGGVSFTANTADASCGMSLGIPGMFSVYNALTAVASALCAGVALEDISRGLAVCEGVRGRAEVVPTGTDYTVLIDYAHTPDALENILNTVKGFARARTIVLFGCGGDRDSAKRPIMGKIAMDLADYVVITSDNPRTEEPEAIIRDILAGVYESERPTPYDVIPDRREAIAHALSIAGPGDVVILAGKGHETYQEVDHVKRRFDEREVVARALEKMNA